MREKLKKMSEALKEILRRMFRREVVIVWYGPGGLK